MRVPAEAADFDDIVKALVGKTARPITVRIATAHHTGRWADEPRAGPGGRNSRVHVGTAGRPSSGRRGQPRRGGEGGHDNPERHQAPVRSQRAGAGREEAPAQRRKGRAERGGPPHRRAVRGRLKVLEELVPGGEGLLALEARVRGPCFRTTKSPYFHLVCCFLL